MSENCCKECGKAKETQCNVCNEMYTGSSKDHLATVEHKNFKALVRSLRELDHDDKNSLFKKYVKKADKKSKSDKSKDSVPLVKPVEKTKKKPTQKTTKN